MNVDFNLIGYKKAKEISQALLGRPTENRVLLAVTQKDRKSDSGLFLPDNDKNELPKKGVIVSKGVLNDDPIHASLNIGDVVLYGIYGGKEIYPEFTCKVEGIEDIKYFVLASNEIIFIEPNTKE